MESSFAKNLVNTMSETSKKLKYVLGLKDMMKLKKSIEQLIGKI